MKVDGKTLLELDLLANPNTNDNIYIFDNTTKKSKRTTLQKLASLFSSIYNTSNDDNSSSSIPSASSVAIVNKVISYNYNASTFDSLHTFTPVVNVINIVSSLFDKDNSSIEIELEYDLRTTSSTQFSLTTIVLGLSINNETFNINFQDFGDFATLGKIEFTLKKINNVFKATIKNSFNGVSPFAPERQNYSLIYSREDFNIIGDFSLNINNILVTVDQGYSTEECELDLLYATAKVINV